jgi:death-on-curing protein
MERDIYGSLYLKAGALLQTLAKLPCLEHSNERFAWHATEAYLILNARELDYPPKAAVALVRDAASGALGVARIARQQRDWTVA